MLHFNLRPLSKLTRQLIFPSIACLGLACGSSDEEASQPDPSPATTTSGNTPASPASAPAGSGTARMPTPEEIAAATDAVNMAADQIQAACGPAFDTCGATPGCNEILTCAARNACSGRDCYCSGADCAMAGPCRGVIDSAPGARVPDASNQSLGPASDAARGIGDCLQGLGGGASSPSPTAPTTAPAGAADAGVDAG